VLGKYWYNDPQIVYMNDEFNGYQNLLNGTLDVMVHERVFDLNIGLENLSFQLLTFP